MLLNILILKIDHFFLESVVTFVSVCGFLATATTGTAFASTFGASTAYTSSFLVLNKLRTS